jgi:hypothetical protein
MRVIQQGNTFRGETPPVGDRIRYYDDERSYTLVLELEDYAFWKDLVVNTEFSKIFDMEFDIRVGMSIVNPRDQFCRKTGLKLALTSMMTVKIQLQQIRIAEKGDIDLIFMLCGQVQVAVTFGSRGKRALMRHRYSHSAKGLYSALYGRS